MRVMVFIILAEVLIEGHLFAYFVLQSPDDEFNSFVSPHELFMINVQLLRTFIIFKRANVESKFFNVLAKLVVRNASVEVLIQPGHQVIDLGLRNCKAHPFK